MLKVASYRDYFSFLLAAILATSAVLTLQLFRSQPGVAATGGPCSTVAQVIEPFEGDIVDGTVDLEVYTPPGSHPGLTSPPSNVIFQSQNAAIGPATSISTSHWAMDWDTTQYPNGPNNVRAKLIFPTSDFCYTDPVNVDIQNTAAVSGQLDLEIVQPASGDWEGPTNVNVTFKAKAFWDVTSGGGNTRTDVTSMTTFTWGTTIGGFGSGSATNGSQFASFFSGPVTGDGEVFVQAEYADQIENDVIDITVVSQNSTDYPGPEGDPDPFDELDEEFDDELDGPLQDGEEAPSRTTLETSGDPALRDCLVSEIGQDGFDQLIANQRRLSFEELVRVQACFATSRYIVPANVAPVDPARVVDLREDQSVAKIENYLQSRDVNGNDTGIILSGTTLPNKTILLYIFSEPLVLTTTADANGNWTYVLEDPLSPGEHEVYVAVEDDNGEIVRSTPISLTISQTTAASTNPTGLSLTLDLQDPGTSATVYYILAVGATVLLGLGALLYISRRDPLSAENKPTDKTAASAK